MRILFRAVLALIALAIVSCLAGFVWFRFYTGDLPDTGSLLQFAPARPDQAFDPCRNASSRTVPRDAIGSTLLAAMHAAEEGNVAGRVTLAMQISRSMFCTPPKPLRRALDELRVEHELERQFTPQQLLTIYANRAYFGQNIVGVQAAAQYFFRKSPGELSVSEAALIAGLIKAPSFYSPSKHPDRALERRNEVIDAMLADRTITAAEAEQAKSKDLTIQY